MAKRHLKRKTGEARSGSRSGRDDAAMGTVLTPREIRDVVEFLADERKSGPAY
jgi:hypothetical protein